jgi:hypothetical protein
MNRGNPECLCAYTGDKTPGSGVGDAQKPSLRSLAKPSLTAARSVHLAIAGKRGCCSLPIPALVLSPNRRSMGLISNRTDDVQQEQC